MEARSTTQHSCERENGITNKISVGAIKELFSQEPLHQGPAAHARNESHDH
jgi:hypothetical protein